MSEKSKWDESVSDPITESIADISTTYTGVDPYNLGYATGMEDIQKYLKALGEVLCGILGILPGNQVSVMWDVSEECKLKVTVSKEV